METNDKPQINVDKLNQTIAKGSSLFSGFSPLMMLIFYLGTAVFLQICFLVLPLWSSFVSFNGFKILEYADGAPLFFAVLANLGFIATVVLGFVLKKILWYMPLSVFVCITICLFSAATWVPVSVIGYLYWIVASTWVVFGFLCMNRKISFEN